MQQQQQEKLQEQQRLLAQQQEQVRSRHAHDSAPAAALMAQHGILMTHLLQLTASAELVCTQRLLLCKGLLIGALYILS